MTAHTGESPTFGLHNDVSGHDIVFSAPKAVSLLWAMEHTGVPRSKQPMTVRYGLQSTS